MIKRSVIVIAAIIAVITAASCRTPSSVTPLSVPLQYKPMLSPAEFVTLPPCASISKSDVTDTRTEKAIGKRFVQGKDSTVVAVTASTDIPTWVRDGLDGAFKRGGAATNATGPELAIAVEQITTSENVLHRSGYEGRVILMAELKSHGGRTCWKDRVEGFSENYGYSGSTENYQETLNHALDRAVARMLNNPDFRKSICDCGGG